MVDIEKNVKGDMTVDEFKEWLDTQWKDADIRSKHYWGPLGRHSGESNRVQEETRDCIGEIKEMCRWNGLKRPMSPSERKFVEAGHIEIEIENKTKIDLPKISKHDNAQKMINRAKSHYNDLRDEGAKAQSWMDTWYAAPDYKRNENWKDAAEEGKRQMADIEKNVKGDMIVDEFKEWLDTQWKDADIRSKHYWGPGGRDSGESNRVQAGTRDCIGEIKEMLG